LAKDKVTLLLDSGAFTAWKRGASVDLKSYIRFCREHEERLYATVNLDVIPGSPELPKADPEAAARGSDRNLQTMLDAGVKNVIPVFHQFEPLRYLTKMVEAGHEYIGISPSDRQPTAQRMKWMDEVYTLLSDSKGRPCVKTHAFGVTSYEVLYTYPFYTADSATWLLLPGHGRLQLPALREDGKGFDFSKQVILVASDKSSTARSPRQLVSMDMQRAVIRRYCEEFGFTEEQARNDYLVRSKISVGVYQRLVQYKAKSPARLDPARLRTYLPGAAPPRPAGVTPLPPYQMQVFYVAWANKAHAVLTELGMMRRLLSYHHIKDWTAEDFDSFMRTGLVGGVYIPRKAAAKNGTQGLASGTKARKPRNWSRRPSPTASTPVVRRRERIGV
jgi:hypothetical protein